MVTFTKEVQSEKAYPSISVTKSGIVILLSEMQPLNALAPIFVTEFGIVMLSSEVQSENPAMLVN